VISAISLPTPFAVGRVNCYLIDDDPLTLVDTGPNSGEALVELSDGLAARGRRIEQLERIVITHQHSDHLGLVGVLAERSGAEVCTLDLLAPVVADYAAAAEQDDELAVALLLRHGVPRDTVSVLRSVSRAYRGWGGSAPVTHVLRDGGELRFAGRTLQVRHHPGHSPTDTVFFDEAAGLLLGGDHLLERSSSNPLIALPRGGRCGEPVAGGRPRALATYMASLRLTRELPIAQVLPGHGAPFSGHAALIDERFALSERRASRIAALIRERPRTAHAVAQAIWGNVAVTQAYLTLSEVLGHVDLLAERGEVVEVERDGVVELTPA